MLTRDAPDAAGVPGASPQAADVEIRPSRWGSFFHMQK